MLDYSFWIPILTLPYHYNPSAFSWNLHQRVTKNTSMFLVDRFICFQHPDTPSHLPPSTGAPEKTVEAWLGRGWTPWRRDNRPRHCLKQSHRNMSDEDPGLAHDLEVTAKRIRITPSTSVPAPASQQQRAFNDVPFPSFYQTSPRKSGSPSQSWSRKSSPIRRLLPQLR